MHSIGGLACLIGTFDSFCMKFVTKKSPSTAMNRNWKQVMIFPAPESSLTFSGDVKCQ